MKGNQSALETEAAEYFDDECKKHYQEKGEYYVVKAYQSTEVKKWKGLKSLICFVKNTEDIKTGKRGLENRYYIASISDMESLTLNFIPFRPHL